MVVIGLLAGFSVLIQHDDARLSARADQVNRVAALYGDVRFLVAEEGWLERHYRLDPSPATLAEHARAVQRVTSDLHALPPLDRGARTGTVIAQLLSLQTSYEVATGAMFQAVEVHAPRYATQLDRVVVDPVLSSMQAIVYDNAARALQRSLADSAALRRDETDSTRAVITAFAIGLALMFAAGAIVVRYRRRIDAAQAAEITRLAEMTITDPLTGLRNHRAFHEDLARAIHRSGRTGIPVSLVMLDLDGLKSVNDELGHQAGDEHLRTLADVILASGRGTDCTYRIGGDEFALILEATRSWGALE